MKLDIGPLFNKHSISPFLATSIYMQHFFWLDLANVMSEINSLKFKLFGVAAH